jgi:phosphoserine phosphatase SerB
VNIGYIENKSKAWESLGKMSKEVARAIIMKARAYRKSTMDVSFEDILAGLRTRLESELYSQIGKTRKLILFDMDNTLISGRFIDYCAETFGFKGELMKLRSFEEDSILLTKRIARLLRGKPLTDLLAIIDKIPIVKGSKEIIGELKRRGYLVGIISDSYDFVTEYLKNKLSIDFSISNELEFSNSICTGEVKIPSYFFKDSSSLCNHAVCKTNALLMVLRNLEIENENTIVVGDSLNDLCMIQNAGYGIAFNPNEPLLDQNSDMVIRKPSFNELLDIAL